MGVLVAGLSLGRAVSPFTTGYMYKSSYFMAPYGPGDVLDPSMIETVPFSFLPFMMAGLVCAVGVAAIVLEPMTHAYLGYTRLISSTDLESSEKEKMEPLF